MRSELPWVKVVPVFSTLKALLPTRCRLAITPVGVRHFVRGPELRVAGFAAQPWATRNNAFGVGDEP